METGTTATTAQASEFVLGGIWVNSALGVADNAGTVPLEAEITNTVEQMASFSEIQTATGTMQGKLTWDGVVPVTYKWAGCIATYKADGVSFIPKIVSII